MDPNISNTPEGINDSGIHPDWHIELPGEPLETDTNLFNQED